jgi:tRNA dimethylallyltransferase
MHARLARVDPASAARIHSNDPQRIQRALEVYELTGLPMSRLLSGAERSALPNPVHTMIIEPRDRSRLHADIAARFHGMLRTGLVDEVTQLRRRYRLGAHTPSMRAVGYRQVGDFLDKHYGYEQMVDRAIAATRQLARRQLTWLRAEGAAAARFDCHAAALQRRAFEVLEGALLARS